jgi:hypothetical protein
MSAAEFKAFTNYPEDHDITETKKSIKHAEKHHKHTIKNAIKFFGDTVEVP